jgi:hypothetical protein
MINIAIVLFILNSLRFIKLRLMDNKAIDVFCFKHLHLKLCENGVARLQFGV